MTLFHPVLVLLATVPPTEDAVTPDPDTVTPGVVGFIATFAIAVVTVLLIIDMVRRVRRVNYRAQVREELEAEMAASAASPGGTATTPGAASPGGTASAVEGRVDGQQQDGRPVAEERDDR